MAWPETSPPATSAFPLFRRMIAALRRAVSIGPRRSPAIRVRMKDFGRIGDAIPAGGASRDEHCSIIQGDTHMIGARGQHGGDAPEPSSPFEILCSRQRPVGVVFAGDEGSPVF